ncbi:MAG: hypothetical protein ACPGQL_00720 [Thermoplasmatota archaeon]
MKNVIWAFMALMALVGLPNASAVNPYEEGKDAYQELRSLYGGGGNCSNYGVAVNSYIFSDPDCSSQTYYQHCDQGTGAGAGAGGGGAGTDVGAEATAGTHCTQSNNGGSDHEVKDPTARIAQVLAEVNSALNDAL